MIQMTYEEFSRLADQQRSKGVERFIIPVYHRLSADLLTPVSAFLILRQAGQYAFLLESVEGGEKLARYSFLGKNPYLVVRAEGRDVQIEDFSSVAGKKNTSIDTSGNVFEVLQQLLDRYTEVKISGLPRFASGAVGYLGYDVVRLIEDLPNPPEDSLGLPDAVWCFYDTIVAFDHVKHQLVVMAGAFIDEDTPIREAFDQARSRVAELEHELSVTTFETPRSIDLSAGPVRSNFTRTGFENAVSRAREYIYEGDIFQVVLSQRFEMDFTGDRFNLYRALRQVNPSPYLFYLDMQDFALIGSSPEVLVRVENRKAEVLPIAGTRKRGSTEEEDVRLEQELLEDPKERAEHLMLVDLGRNDLGRVCSFDTIQVDRYAFVERFSHVMHIVSSVSGYLKDKTGAMDVLSACFPAGTVSGAPKVRAMEIIDELEPGRRGIYAGAVGYVDFSGNLDACIAIRTMVVRGDTIYVQAGAGIVADSDPAGEYEETVNKARALRQAILLASEGLLQARGPDEELKLKSV